VISYSGDTEWTETLVNTARGADIFICEAYFFAKKIPYHLDYQTLWDRRAQLECSRLILTHMSDEMLAHLAETKIERAEDGKTVII